ncbi:MAG TPA: MDR family MFS transporter [Devosiaceae bacterium]|nr:MDR family MFS transporter [Devosiaceae bacterium]
MTNAVRASQRPYVLGSIMLANFMVAIEATIVATAMPRIVGDLGGFTYYSWVFSAFLLTQSATTVVYGKLADVFGRKPVLIVGIVLFLLGSLLSGFANSMAMLIAFRLLQGLGAGAIQPITMTIIGDLYTLEQRAKVQGLMSTVWAFSAVVGPLVGGIIVEHLPWSWIFWINVPIGILTIVGFALFLEEKVGRRGARVDYLGSVLFSIAVVALLVMLTETDAGLPTILGLALVFVVSGGLFVLQERRAAEPIISIALWAQRLIATSNAATLFAGMVMIGMTTVLPLYVQGVMGYSTVIAGFTLTALVVGWPIAVMGASLLFKTFGIRLTLRVGSLLLPVGALFLLVLTPESSPVLPGIGAFLMGFGMGLISLTTVALVQDSVEWSARGSATASIMFARSLGNTLGATVLGAVLNLGIAYFGTGPLAESVRQVLNEPTGLANLAANADARTVFDQSLHWTFIGVLVICALTAISTWMVPIKRNSWAKAAPGANAIEDAVVPIGDIEP